MVRHTAGTTVAGSSHEMSNGLMQATKLDSRRSIRRVGLDQFPVWSPGLHDRICFGGGTVDAMDSKSIVLKGACEFDSRPEYKNT